MFGGTQVSKSVLQTALWWICMCSGYTLWESIGVSLALEVGIPGRVDDGPRLVRCTGSLIALNGTSPFLLTLPRRCATTV